MEQSKPAEAPKPKSKTMWIVLAAVVVIVIIVAAVFLSGILTPSAGKSISIFETPVGACTNATDCGYNPSSQSIAVNTKVTWTNNGQQTHTVTSCSTDNSPPTTPTVACPTMNDSTLSTFNSQSKTGGQTFDFTFTKAGTYYYYCAVHPWMQATVTVTA